MGEKPCFIYAIAPVRNGRPVPPVKIGMSDAPMVRLAELQTGSPAPLTIVGMLLAPNRDIARDTECFIHACHPDRRLHGEWFQISPWYAVSMMGHFLEEKIAEYFGHERDEEIPS